MATAGVAPALGLEPIEQILRRLQLGIVGVEQVHPPEERLVDAGEPLDREIGRLIAPALLDRTAAREVVVEELEALGESKLGGGGRCADEGSGPVTGVAQDLGERNEGVVESCGALVDHRAHTVVVGLEPGEDRGVYGVGHRRGCDSVPEEDAVRGQAVENRTRRQRIAVAAQAISARGVERHQERARCDVRRPRTAGQEGRCEAGQSHQATGAPERRAPRSGLRACGGALHVVELRRRALWQWPRAEPGAR